MENDKESKQKCIVDSSRDQFESNETKFIY